MSWSPKRAVLASDEVRVPFRLVNGTPYVDVDLGGSTSSFLLDTGAANVVLLPKLAEEEDLVSISTGTGRDHAGGTVSTTRTHVLSMSVGGVRLDDLDVDVSPIQNIAGVERTEVGGVLGWPAFSDLLLTIDYPNGTLIFHRGELAPVDGKEILQITQKDGNLFIPVTLNGAELALILDTGAAMMESVVLAKNQAVDLKWCAPVADYYSKNAYGESPGKIGRVNGGLKIGRYLVTNPVAYVDDVREMGIIGSGVLANFTVTFDFRNMRVRLARESNEPLFATGVGPDLTFHFAGNKVVSVAAGGVADRVGIRVGDEIVRMNGQTAAPGEDTYKLANWPEGQPLILELRREGQPVRVELNVKPLVR